MRKNNPVDEVKSNIKLFIFKKQKICEYDLFDLDSELLQQ